MILRSLHAAGDEVNVGSDITDLTHWVHLKSALAYIEDVFVKILSLSAITTTSIARIVRCTGTGCYMKFWS